ncbi:hypothetical protein KBI23_08430 [bacterium]|nr:hypothetical protein [bacterium]
MDIPKIIIALIALALVWTADFLVKKRKRAAAIIYERQLREQLLNDLPQRIFDTVHKCAKYLRIPPERVLDLNEPIEIELPVRCGYGRYIPTNLMITQHLQGAISSLCDARAAILVNDLFLADVKLQSVETSLQAALRGKELRDAETAALAETQLALQAVQK